MNRLRNVLLPPPAFILGLLILVSLVSYRLTILQRSEATDLPTALTSSRTTTGLDMFDLPVQQITQEDQEIISQRTLFREDRKPWAVLPVIEEDPFLEIEEDIESEPEILPPEPVLPPNVLLLGMMVVSDERRALIFDEQTQEERWISVSAQIGDWVVVEIRKNDIILNFEEQETIVTYNR